MREGRTFLYRMSCLPVSGTGRGLGRVTGGALPRRREACSGYLITRSKWGMRRGRHRNLSAGASLRHSAREAGPRARSSIVSRLSPGGDIAPSDVSKGECSEICVPYTYVFPFPCPLSYCFVLGIAACSALHCMYMYQHRPHTEDAATVLSIFACRVQFYPSPPSTLTNLHRSRLSAPSESCR